MPTTARKALAALGALALATALAAGATAAGHHGTSHARADGCMFHHTGPC